MSAMPREGSSLYYCVWGLDDEVRKRALARLSLGTALHQAVQDVREPDVAQRKVHWWHEELERLHAGAPRHPACVDCAELAGSDAALTQALEVLGAAAQERLEPARTESELDARLLRGAGARLWLVLDGLAPDTVADKAPLPAHWRDIAIGLARHERLAQLAALLSREHPVFPIDAWQAQDARAPDIGSDEPEARARGDRLIGDAIDIARERLAEGLSACGSAVPRGSAARAPLTLARLRDAQLALWQRQRPDLVRERPSLTPIRKFFIAWRTR